MSKKPQKIKPKARMNSRWKKLLSEYKDSDELKVVIDAGSPRFINQYLDSRQKALVASILNGRKVNSILDAGCGTGRWLPFLSQFSEKVVGVDEADFMLAHASKHAGRNIRLFHASNTALPFKSGSFDLVFCSYVLQHINEQADFEKAVSEISRVLKKDGIIILIESTNKRTTDTKYHIARTPAEYVSSFAKNGLALERMMGIHTSYLFSALVSFSKLISFPFWYRGVNTREAFMLWLGHGNRRFFAGFFARSIFSAATLPDRLAPGIMEPFSSEKVLVFRRGANGGN